MKDQSIVRQATQAAARVVLMVLIGSFGLMAFLIAEGVRSANVTAIASQRVLAATRAIDQINLSDERLTMSALMASVTGDTAWIDRYEAELPAIDRAISEAMALAPPAMAERFEEATKLANDRLVIKEQRSFDLVRAGQLAEAHALLTGPEYAADKQLLSHGTDIFTNQLRRVTKADLAREGERANTILMAIAIIAVGVMTHIWFRLKSYFRRTERAYMTAEQRIRELALNDNLTNLPNRRSFRDAFAHGLDRAADCDLALSVLMIDLDRFKPVNDRHGHLVGDLVLKEIAGRLASVLRREEFIARLGGDEFVVVMSHDRDRPDQRVDVARRLIEATAAPIDIGNQALTIGASIGIASFPADAKDGDTLMRKADSALYRAKARGGNAVHAYSIEMDEDLDQRETLESTLRLAVQRGEFEPFFQPLLDLKTGSIASFEVLARWNHPTRGILPPSDFIETLEQTGQISEMMLQILEKACLVARDWPTTCPIAVNVAAQQIQDPWFAERVLAVLQKTGFPAQRLEIELTENVLVTGFAAAKRVMLSLRNLGIRVALDDFGTGYSSLSYLSELPFDKIKIDRSFVRTLHDRAESAKIVNAIIGLGHSLGLPTVAEGIETEHDADVLRAFGCSYGQGYLFSRPVSADAAGALVTAPSLFAAEAAAALDLAVPAASARPRISRSGTA